MVVSPISALIRLSVLEFVFGHGVLYSTISLLYKSVVSNDYLHSCNMSYKRVCIARIVLIVFSTFLFFTKMLTTLTFASSDHI